MNSRTRNVSRVCDVRTCNVGRIGQPSLVRNGLEQLSDKVQSIIADSDKPNSHLEQLGSNLNHFMQNM